jgi:hypothetical protein
MKIKIIPEEQTMILEDSLVVEEGWKETLLVWEVIVFALNVAKKYLTEEECLVIRKNVLNVAN